MRNIAITYAYVRQKENKHNGVTLPTVNPVCGYEPLTWEGQTSNFAQKQIQYHLAITLHSQTLLSLTMPINYAPFLDKNVQIKNLY